jgi:hypothetical protein
VTKPIAHLLARTEVVRDYKDEFISSAAPPKTFVWCNLKEPLFEGTVVTDALDASLQGFELCAKCRERPSDL